MTKKCNFFVNLQRSNLVWAAFENIALSEKLQYFEKKSTIKFKPHPGRFAYFGQIQLYFQKQPSADILQKYFEIFRNNFFCRATLVTTSVFWTITMLNVNRVSENLRTMNNFNCTNFFSDKRWDALWKAHFAAFA